MLAAICIRLQDVKTDDYCPADDFFLQLQLELQLEQQTVNLKNSTADQSLSVSNATSS